MEKMAHGGCRLFAILEAGESMREGSIVRRVASWIAGRGVRVLMLLVSEGRIEDVRQIGEARVHLGQLSPEALRGYLDMDGAGPGSLSLALGVLRPEELSRLADCYDLILFWSLEPSGRELAPSMEGIPAMIVADARERGGIERAGQLLHSALGSVGAFCPVAFSLIPFDIAAAARLSERWSLPSWGDGADAGSLAERVLERAVPLCTDAADQSPEDGGGEYAVRRSDAVVIVLKRLREDREFLKIRDELPSCSDGELFKRRVEEVARRIAGAMTPQELNGGGMEEVVSCVVEEAVGLGPIEPLLRDDEVTEVMVSGPDRIYVERAGELQEVPLCFSDTAHLMAVIERMLAPTGRRIDEASPMVDARLPDGSRLHAIIPPLAIDGPSLTIRRFSKCGWGLADLVQRKMMPQRTAEFLSACVAARISIIVSGGTGTGKTTLLGALASLVEEVERVITIEDAAELRIDRPHVVRLEARPPNIEGAGAVTIRDLVRNALRMRPDRIVVGECRGAEAIDMLQAMNTGHEGSLTTVHANSPRDAVSRLETMVLMAGLELPVVAAREQIVRAIDIVVQLARIGAERRVVEISEITGMEGHVVSMQTLAAIEHRTRELKPTGLVPRFRERLLERGAEFDRTV